MEQASGGVPRKDNIRYIVTLVILGVISLILIITGIVLLCYSAHTYGIEISTDYTDCLNSDETEKCKDTLSHGGTECKCFLEINVTEPMKAPVTVFYKLDSYYEMISTYSTSRDDNQLSGNLSLQPSSTCGEFRFANTSDGLKPIAPCGELANAMFTDSFRIHINNSYVPIIFTGLLSEDLKKPYRNPPGDLKIAFKDYAKPKSWTKNIWELDTFNQSNNGFQNEPFIAWMTTDLKQKPSWRFNHTGAYENGVPAGKYYLKINYVYPPQLYGGRRIFIISNTYEVINYTPGTILLVLGLFAITATLLMFRKIYKKIKLFTYK